MSLSCSTRFVCLLTFLTTLGGARSSASSPPRAATNNTRSWTLILIFTLSALASVDEDFMGPLCLAGLVTTLDSGGEARWTTPLLTRLEDSLLCGEIPFVSTPLMKLSVHRIEKQAKVKLDKATHTKCNT